MEALELYKEETEKRKEIEAQESQTGKKVSGRINFKRFVFLLNRRRDIPGKLMWLRISSYVYIKFMEFFDILLQKDSIALHPMFQAYNVSTPIKFVLEVLKKVKSR